MELKEKRWVSMSDADEGEFEVCAEVEFTANYDRGDPSVGYPAGWEIILHSAKLRGIEILSILTEQERVALIDGCEYAARVEVLRLQECE